MKRILCLLFGHPDSVIEWGEWQESRHVPRHRMLVERCTRCDVVLGQSRIVEPWP